MKSNLKIIFITIMVLNNLTMLGQDHVLDWAKAMGGSSSEVGTSITTDASGNIYTTGYFEGTVDFDPGVGTSLFAIQGGWDIFIQKLKIDCDTTGTDIITACDSYTWIDGNTYTTSNNSATHTL